MILFRASNLAEMTGVPEFYVDAVGVVTVSHGNIATLMCREVEFGSDKLLVPKCELVRPLALLPVIIERMQRSWEAAVMNAPIGSLEMPRLRHH